MYTTDGRNIFEVARAGAASKLMCLADVAGSEPRDAELEINWSFRASEKNLIYCAVFGREGPGAVGELNLGTRTLELLAVDFPAGIAVDFATRTVYRPEAYHGPYIEAATVHVRN